MVNFLGDVGWSDLFESRASPEHFPKGHSAGGIPVPLAQLSLPANPQYSAGLVPVAGTE